MSIKPSQDAIDNYQFQQARIDALQAERDYWHRRAVRYQALWRARHDQVKARRVVVTERAPLWIGPEDSASYLDAVAEIRDIPAAEDFPDLPRRYRNALIRAKLTRSAVLGMSRGQLFGVPQLGRKGVDTICAVLGVGRQT